MFKNVGLRGPRRVKKATHDSRGVYGLDPASESKIFHFFIDFGDWYGMQFLRMLVPLNIYCLHKTFWVVEGDTQMFT